MNKGVDFIDLQNVLCNMNMMVCIPKYFKILEPPIICYKYTQ